MIPPTDWIQIGILLVTAIIAIAGWWYRKNQDAHSEGEEQGAIAAQLSNIKESMKDGFGTVYHRIDDIKESFVTCRQEENARINHLTQRVDTLADNMIIAVNKSKRLEKLEERP
jgi:hypothetical protein